MIKKQKQKKVSGGERKEEKRDITKSYTKHKTKKKFDRKENFLKFKKY